MKVCVCVARAAFCCWLPVRTCPVVWVARVEQSASRTRQRPPNDRTAPNQTWNWLPTLQTHTGVFARASLRARRRRTGSQRQRLPVPHKQRKLIRKSANVEYHARMIIVTGAAGFLGSNTIAALNAEGVQDIVA